MLARPCRHCVIRRTSGPNRPTLYGLGLPYVGRGGFCGREPSVGSGWKDKDGAGRRSRHPWPHHFRLNGYSRSRVIQYRRVGCLRGQRARRSDELPNTVVWITPDHVRRLRAHLCLRIRRWCHPDRQQLGQHRSRQCHRRTHRHLHLYRVAGGRPRARRQPHRDPARNWRRRRLHRTDPDRLRYLRHRARWRHRRGQLHE